MNRTPCAFSASPNLALDLAARMQAVADRRAVAGLISADGTTHKTAAAMAVYDAGGSPHYAEYLAAALGGAA